MYVVNTSFIVEPPVHAQWYDFVVTKLIPQLRAEGYEKLLFTRVLTNNRDPHYTYSLQIDAVDIPTYQRLTDELLAEYTSFATSLFGEQVLHFTTLLKKIDTEP